MDETASTTERAVAAGAHQVSTPTVTPWRSLNARVDAPGDVQVTFFQEMESLDERARRQGFGTAASRAARTHSPS